MGRKRVVEDGQGHLGAEGLGQGGMILQPERESTRRLTS